MTQSRTLAVLVVSLLLGSLAGSPVLAWPWDDVDSDYVPDPVEDEVCGPGDQNAAAAVGQCSGGDWAWSTEVLGVFAAFHQEFCTSFGVPGSLNTLETTAEGAGAPDLVDVEPCTPSWGGVTPNGPDTSDDDTDGVPDSLEAALCGNADVAGALEQTTLFDCDDDDLSSTLPDTGDADGDDVPDGLEAALCGDATISGALEQTTLFECDGDDLSPGSLPAVGDLDSAWDAIQTTVFDPYCVALGTVFNQNLGAVQFEYTILTQNGGTTILDRDGDGSADGGKMTVTYPQGSTTASRDVWFQCDYVWGPLSDNTTMILTQPINQVAPFNVDRPDYRTGGLQLNVSGGKAFLHIISTENSNATHTKITIDPGAPTETAVIISVEHPTERYIPLRIDGTNFDSAPLFGVDPPPVSVPAIDLLWAPIDLNHILPLKPTDLDGDGVVHQAELITGPEYGRLPANPLNRFSVPGDADGDGCPYSEEEDDDKDRGISACFPFDLSLLGLDADITTPERRIWGTLSLTLRTTNTTASLYSPSEARIKSYQVYRTVTNNPNEANPIMMCSGTNIDVLSPTFTIPCTLDTTIIPDNGDVAGDPATYYAWTKVCIVGNPAGSPCRFAPTLPFVVQNRPIQTYRSFEDLIPGDTDDDRNGWISDIALLNVTASHPGIPIDKFVVEVAPCIPTNNGPSCNFNTNGVTFEYELPHANVSLVDPLDGDWTLRFDTNTFPKMAQNQEYIGVKMRITAHAGDHSRTGNGHLPAEQVSPPGATVMRVFNNRAPEVTSLTETNRTAHAYDPSVDVTFGFRYSDPDRTTPSSVKVRVDGEDVTCSKQAEGTQEQLLGDASPWNALYQCRWDAKTRDGFYTWRVIAVDGDRGDNTKIEISPEVVDIRNSPPTLTGYEPTVITSPNTPPNSPQETYEFRVRYTDTQNAARYVNVTVQNVTLGVLREQEMEPCRRQTSLADTFDSEILEPLTGGPAGTSGREGDYCANIVLDRGADWDYTFTAKDIRDGVAPAVEDVLRIPGCPTCSDAGDAYNMTQGNFAGFVQTLNGLQLSTPVSGWTVNDQSALPVDDDGDFVPGLVEATALETNIFTVDPDTGVITFEDEWSIAVRAPDGLGSSEFDYLRLTISSDQDAALYSIKVCGAATTCIFEDEDVGFLRYAVTPGGFVITAFRGPEHPPLLRLELDTTKLHSKTQPAITARFELTHQIPSPALTLGGTITANVFTNPVDVKLEGTGQFTTLTGRTLYGAWEDAMTQNTPVIATDFGADGYEICIVPLTMCQATGWYLPRFGFDRNAATNEQFLWVDVDGQGDMDRVELTAGDEALDQDGDGEYDAQELVYCLTTPDWQTECSDEDGDPFGIHENHLP